MTKEEFEDKSWWFDLIVNKINFDDSNHSAWCFYINCRECIFWTTGIKPVTCTIPLSSHMTLTDFLKERYKERLL